MRTLTPSKLRQRFRRQRSYPRSQTVESDSQLGFVWKTGRERPGYCREPAPEKTISGGVTHDGVFNRVAFDCAERRQADELRLRRDLQTDAVETAIASPHRKPGPSPTTIRSGIPKRFCVSATFLKKSPEFFPVVCPFARPLEVAIGQASCRAHWKVRRENLHEE